MTKAEFIELRDKAEKKGEDCLAKSEREALKPYKVDNAIIMAAGYSARCMPLSNILPKGLFRIKGEVLIEREIAQLQAAGIQEIIVVTGFSQEQFQYLKDKYNVILIHNADYDKYNNISSLYVAQEYMKNSYILCSDNYYVDNVFQSYVFTPYYSCVYSEEFCDEFCVTKVNEDGIIEDIRRGGSKAWYTIGDCYFDCSFSKIFKEYMNAEWDDISTRKMLMDDFHIRHIDELKLLKVERDKEKVLEFDTLDEIKAFDKEFDGFINEKLDQNNPVIQVFNKYSDIKSYHSVPTEQQGGRLHLNENLFQPSPKCLDVIKKTTMEDLYLYDLSRNDYLIDEISKSTGISSNNIFVHNGSAEVIKSIGSILLNENDNVLIPHPGWSYYKSIADTKFAKCIPYTIKEEGDRYYYDFDDIAIKAKAYLPKLIIITSPQMPTGCLAYNIDIENVIKENPGSIILLDEAYWGYENDDSSFEKELITKYNNVIITRTFSKFYGLANIRLGYGLCSYPLRRTVGLDLPLFRAAGISRKIATVALQDKEYYDNLRKECCSVRRWFIDELNKIEGIKAFESASNYVFVHMDKADPIKVRAYMEENNILIRLFVENDCLRLRITIAPKPMMERVVYQLRKTIS